MTTQPVPPATRPPDEASAASAEAAEGRPAVRPKHARRNLLLGVGLLAVIAAGIGGYWFIFMRGIVYSDDARLSGDLVDLAPEVAGRLAAVEVREGARVRHGDVLFRLDASIPQAQLVQAEAAHLSARAALTVVQARLERAVNGSRPEEIKAAEAILARLKNEEALARSELVRAEALARSEVLPQAQLDRARTAAVSAEQSRAGAEQNLALLREGSRPEDLSAARAEAALAEARITEAEAAVEKARRSLAQCTVAAPSDGWVVRRWLDPGALAQAGQPVLSLFDPASLRVDANIEEKSLGRVAVGDQVEIRVDAYPGLRLTGRVTEILRATNSQFSLIPAEGVSGTFIKVTQRVPLRIALLDPPPELPLGPGLSVEVRIRVGSAGEAGQPSVASAKEGAASRRPEAR